ncbi:neo-calmodulin-like [Lycorma delicatula]|uniref:neo-calmodulin-like n=1 Tax=Lycorma delicatula TaxID=130591 RepID=UPI003F516A64
MTNNEDSIKGKGDDFFLDNHCFNNVDDDDDDDEDFENKYRLAFSVLDDDSDGIVKREQLESAFENFLGLDSTGPEFRVILSEMNADVNGNVTLDGFLSAMKRSGKISIKKHGDLLRVLDSNSSGRIGTSDWKKILLNFGINLSEDEVKEAVRKAEKISSELLSLEVL